MTTEARAVVLARVQRALGPSAPATRPVLRSYRQGGELAAGSPELVALLVDRLVDYRATVHRVALDDAAAAICDIAAGSSAGPRARYVVAADLAAHWRTGWEAVDDDGFSAAELDRFDGTVTTCAVAVAETGTLVLDTGPGQGRRAISLVPDLHVCLVAEAQVVQTVPEGLSRLDPRRPITFVSGPSATSDIELQRVEGVHGPRTLHVVIVDAG